MVVEGARQGAMALVTIAFVAVGLNEILAAGSLPDTFPVWLLVAVLLLPVVAAGEAITGGLGEMFGF